MAADSSILQSGISRPDYQLDHRYDRREVFLTGTQALVRLPIEQIRLDRSRGLNTAGYITGYRGSPLAAYDLALAQAAGLLADHGVKFAPAINEELAATALVGVQEAGSDPDRTVDGVFGLWYGKGPGVDRAGDALKHGNALGASSLGGVLALLGDDHGCVSSSMPHQSDHALASFMMPVLHPASVADYIPFGLFGIAASRFTGAWIGMKTISEVLESGATITVADRPEMAEPAYGQPGIGLHHDPENSFGPILEQRMLRRLDAFRAFAAANPLDRASFGQRAPKIAIIAVGKAYFDVIAALRDLGIDGSAADRLGLGVYKVGISWPIEPAGYEAFLANATRVLVVEEKRAVVEPQIKDLLYNRSDPRPIIIGKRDQNGEALLSEGAELRPSRISPIIRRFLDLPCSSGRQVGTAAVATPLQIERRVPYFCSGCPHNRSTKVPKGSRALPGIGCHFMASWMDRDTRGIVQMGGEGVNWIGWAPFTKRPHMFQNLGDGTYFHSGYLAIRQAVAARTNVTYKILFNDAVAMTGGQAIDGKLTVEDIVRQVRAEGVHRIAVLSEDPSRFDRNFPSMSGVTLSHRDKLDAIQDELRTIEGVTVLIYDQGCAAEKRRKRRRGSLEEPNKRVFINTAVCEGCGDCSVQSNCIAVVPVKTSWGTKRAIEQTSCNKDFSCVQGFCPSFVTVTGEKVPNTGDEVRREALLDRARRLAEPSVRPGATILITGIGGTGVVTIGAVLAVAAHLDGKACSVLDFMGFAQKGGAVTSHLKISAHNSDGEPARIDSGMADVLISCDLIVASTAEALGTLSPDRSRAVVNGVVQATADFVLRGAANFEEGRRIRMLTERTLQVDVTAATTISTTFLGDSVFANMLLVGVAWQKGLVPLSRAAIRRSIELNGRAVASNLAAFELGRLAAADPGLFEPEGAPDALEAQSLDNFIHSRSQFLVDYQNADYARLYRDFVDRVREVEGRFGSTVLTRAVADNLSRLMACKDEYEVARLHLDGIELAAMRARFKNGGSMTFHFAPPFLSFVRDASGRPRKLAIPGWIAVPVLHLLRALRPLRHTPFDIFGWATERREDRRVVIEYKQLVEALLVRLAPDTVAEAAGIASLIDQVRGYGPVRASAIEKYESERDARLREFTVAKSAA